MTTKYICDFCEKEFSSEWICRTHELSHLSGADKVKYELYSQGKEVCDYCFNSYYVYGCEQDCNYSNCNYDNNHKDFIPVEPLHNKRRNGGV